MQPHCPITPDICAAWGDGAEAQQEYDGELASAPMTSLYDVIPLALAHVQFLELGAAGVRAHGKDAAVLFDVKSALQRDAVYG